MTGFGIQGMRERVSAPGGDLTLEKHNGTRVIVNLPTFFATNRRITGKKS